MVYDVVVVGGGPAGMAAAIAASNQGVKTLLIERSSSLGGILNQCIHNGFGLHYFKEELTGPEYALRFVSQIEQSKVKVLLNTHVVKIEKNLVSIINQNGKQTIKAKAVVLAMGCRERTAGAINLTGTRPAGVYTAGAAQKMVNIYGKLPGKKAVILGSGDIGLIMARRLVCEGAQVEMVLEIMPRSGGLARNIQQCLNDFNIPLLLNTTVTRVVGDSRIEGVYYAQVDSSLKPIMDTEKFVECDCLILSVGLIPETDLLHNIEINRQTGGSFVDENHQTNLSGIFACGNVLHVHDLVDNVSVEAQQTGRQAALFALGKLQGKGKVAVECGNGIRYTVPSFVYKSGESETEILFRVDKKYEKLFLCAKSGGKVISKKYVMGVNPGEMQSLKIIKKELNDDLIISVEEKV